MKRFLTSLTVGLCVAATASAQTMNIRTGSITYAFDAATVGEMTYDNGGTELTVQGKTFAVADIDRMYIDNSSVQSQTVSVVYSGQSATVVVSGDVAAQLTTLTVNGADVTIVQSPYLTEEITYTLSGRSSNGSFNMDGDLKATIVLNDLTLTSNSGAPINVDNGKRIQIVVQDGTTNTFSDYAGGTQKACFFINGHAEFEGAGTINITGNAKHGYRSDEYTKLKKTFTGTINILKAASDGMHVCQYLQMNNGKVVISNVGGDGIDVEVTKDETDENNGCILINGGSLTATTTADDVKTLKADADISITDGTLYLMATGAGSKAIGANGALTISGGKTEALSIGGVYKEDTAQEAKPNAVKADGVVTISGGEVYAVGANKAVNSDVEATGFVINGGKVLTVSHKANAQVSGSQSRKTYTKVLVNAGATVSYNGISYTVPSTYSCASAYVLVSPI